MIFEVSSHIFERSRSPKILYSTGLTFFKTMEEAFTTFETIMLQNIKQREEELQVLRSSPGTTDEEVSAAIRDVFGCLVNARMNEGKHSMSDGEIMSNCLAFVSRMNKATCRTSLYRSSPQMFAGHGKFKLIVFLAIISCLFFPRRDNRQYTFWHSWAARFASRNPGEHLSRN